LVSLYLHSRHFVLANTVAYFIWVAAVDQNTLVWWHGGQFSESDMLVAWFNITTLLWDIILLADTLLLVKAAITMGNELKNQVSPNGAAATQAGFAVLPLQHIHTTVSRKLDTPGLRHLTLNNFVSLLYVVAALSGAGSLVLLGLRIVTSSIFRDHCLDEI
jgi:hypothetical protein